MKPVNFFAASDIVVVGQNYEMADYDNPQGYLYGFASYVYAEAESGERVRKLVKTTYSEAEAMEPAIKMADALNARLLSGKLPVAFNTWQATFPAYGSDAYDEEETIEWERSLED